MRMHVLKKQDERYPEQLRAYPRMPDQLYVIGTLPDPAVRSVAIVGARNCSHYGYREAYRFGEALAQNGIQIISGMALGCDAAGHEGALKGGGKTFAVLGSGADVCYPESNRHLYRQIPAAGGGILSEFEPGTPAIGWHFPIRNRIISALADLILVVEARARSGSLITVEYGLEQGKLIYAVPGRNRDPASAGCNRLIAQGAGIANDPEELIAELQNQQIPRRPVSWTVPSGEEDAKKPPDGNPVFRDDDPLTGQIAAVLDFDEQDSHAIASRAACSHADACRALLKLCAAGYAREVLPGYFCRL